MKLQASRNISILSKIRNSVSGKKNSTDISGAVATNNLPRATGNGPFAELPKFEAIGQPSSLLNVTLPASSRLNIRNGSIIAMNGNLNHLTTSLKNLSNFYPLIYQEIKSVSPVSILISGSGTNFSILDIGSSSEKWIIANSKNVIAWSGYDLQLIPESRNLVRQGSLFRLDRFTGLHTAGKGKLVLSGKNDLFDIELSEGEELMLEPSVLIAHNDIGAAHFRTIRGSQLFQLPSYPWFSRLGIRSAQVYSYLEKWAKYGYLRLTGGSYRTQDNGTQRREIESSAQSTSNETSSSSSSSSSLNSVKASLTKTTEFVRKQFSRLGQKDVYYHVKGPCKLLISSSNGGIPRRATFTKEDLQSIRDTLN
ncbi:altered inheritance of mitochondria protein 24, mitochondrial [[Candida] railenensis]|uniref:Altered inheritance of mitochondria protein 24, mitochondrial n=1 Tax=[Candida] railenensis TaxID=45579 RepID=A0A9P0QSQ6_9ASCO|nr:altered inheritance of mitochondria protein 24, mitochondrial [[Candida] railenensis]